MSRASASYSIDWLPIPGMVKGYSQGPKNIILKMFCQEKRARLKIVLMTPFKDYSIRHSSDLKFLMG